MASNSLKDLMSATAVTAPVTQPPSGVAVTEAQDKSVEANILAQAEQKEQQATHEQARPHADPNYKFTISQGAHSIEILPKEGVFYNYIAKCSCAWEGRFFTTELAELYAKKHIAVRNKQG